MSKTEILEGLYIKDRINCPDESDIGAMFIGDDTVIPITNKLLTKHIL